MTAEFPPPDARFAGKVKFEQILAQHDVLRVASNGHPNGSELQPDAKGEISRLAKLGKADYERERKAAAKRLGFRAPVLDSMVAAERPLFDDGNKQGRALSLPEPKPWPKPVNGAELLDELAVCIRRYVVMPDHAADTAALWTLHTYMLHCFGISPRLAITSPEKGCGKTTLLDVLSHLAMRPLSTANATPAAIFRVAAAVDRKLFWRYKGKWQHAARIGDYKYLKILDNAFLFNVVEDPLERANLKERHKDIYERLVAEWQAWNATMLPEIAESFTRAFTGEDLVDHYGSQQASGAPDPSLRLPPATQSAR